MLPGPNFIVTARRSMAVSGRSGLGVALGISLGAAVWCSASLLGLHALFHLAGWLYGLLKTAGGLYLIYLGLKAIRSAAMDGGAVETPAMANDGGLDAVRLGMLTSFSNPKTAVFFGSIILPFMPPEAPFWVQAASVVEIFAISLAWYGLVALLFAAGRVRGAYAAAKRPLEAAFGCLFVFLGGKLALDRDFGLPGKNL